MVHDPEKAKEIRDRLLRKNPNHYKDIRKKRTDYSKGNFGDNPELASRAGIISREKRRAKKT